MEEPLNHFNPEKSVGEVASSTIAQAIKDVHSLRAFDEGIYEVPLKDHTEKSLAIAVVGFFHTTLPDDLPTMISAIKLATELHSPDLRYGEGNCPRPYIIHPLRNTLRLIRLGVENVPLLLASVLHDTVEDHPFELAAKARVTTQNEAEARESALAFLADTYGEETARIVEGMSNPVITDKCLTREQFVQVYLDHVRTATRDPNVFACKVSDLIDNAVGLVHEEYMEPARMLRMAKKYCPAIEIMLTRLEQGEKDGDMLFSSQGIKSVRSQLELGHDRLRKVLQEEGAI